MFEQKNERSRKKRPGTMKVLLYAIVKLGKVNDTPNG